MKYKFSAKALEDIEGIWMYTASTWSVEQADRYVNLIFDEVEYLARNPHAGKDIRSIRENYWCAKVKSHLIFYKLTGTLQLIEIIRVLHERMDIENQLKD
ncbi:type II toxin-antitoxin system RelE/ParE family toxin [Cytophagales bacterium LB-30]|uniref:Toxin n=1 Tax=Shiella aurantiaca TaxID=3058365 RepID=A0ABT8F8F2_9BACT|nr:type II toxin-antitoxin system RelE/ParE family toxin [Shiella aurantiaca]MDN4166221.1 type II toxin-antitoxin system RelE/ParE family toxin [Shiella aurantiaca]